MPPDLVGDDLVLVYTTFLAVSATKGDAIAFSGGVYPTKGEVSSTSLAISSSQGDEFTFDFMD